jgi:hypothetical protein
MRNNLFVLTLALSLFLIGCNDGGGGNGMDSDAAMNMDGGMTMDASQDSGPACQAVSGLKYHNATAYDMTLTNVSVSSSCTSDAGVAGPGIRAFDTSTFPNTDVTASLFGASAIPFVYMGVDQGYKFVPLPWNGSVTLPSEVAVDGGFTYIELRVFGTNCALTYTVCQ